MGESARERIYLLHMFGEDLGWTTTEPRRGSTRKGLVLHAPPPYANVSIALPPNGNLRDTSNKQICRKLLRYADPLKRVTVLASYKIADLPFTADDLAPYVSVLGEPVEKARRHGSSGSGNATVLSLPAPASEHRPLPLAKDAPPTAAPRVQVPKPAPPASKPAPAAPPGKTLISERPWLAHHGLGSKGVGLSYESLCVIERRWSDGSIDYRCASTTKCDYEHKAPRSVARHYGASVTAGKHPKIGKHPRRDQLLVDSSYNEPAWTRPVTDRVDRLRREIHRALAKIWDQLHDVHDRDDLATRLAEVMVEARGEHDPEHHEPLTPEQTIERIRRLVDDGSYARQIAQVTDTQAQLAAMQVQLVHAQALADKWVALQDIMRAEMTDES